MADAPVVHIGENSPEQVAYKLMQRISEIEKGFKDRKAILDAYHECIEAVRGHRDMRK
jgi:hypothetical protein